jgi:hypothetical protein
MYFGTLGHGYHPEVSLLQTQDSRLVPVTVQRTVRKIKSSDSFPRGPTLDGLFCSESEYPNSPRDTPREYTQRNVLKESSLVCYLLELKSEAKIPVSSMITA